MVSRPSKIRVITITQDARVFMLMFIFPRVADWDMYLGKFTEDMQTFTHY